MTDKNSLRTDDVRRVAKAIYDDCHGWFDERLDIGPDDMEDTARAAIAALDQVRGQADPSG